MASGFMTLPVPILGNTYAMVQTSGSMENTLNQRGTPAIYWASLWNRCLAIVDNHDHNSGDTSTYGDQGSHHGKPLKWGSPLNSGTGGILVSHDFDLFQGPESKINGIKSSYAVKDLKMASLSKYANIIDEASHFPFTTSYVDGPSRPYISGTDNTAIYGSTAFPLNDPWKYGGSVYIRNRIAYNSKTGTGTGYATNFNYVPQLELLWNNASASKEGTVIVDNSPAGDRFAAWKLVQSMGNQSTNEGYFTGWYDSTGSGTSTNGVRGGLSLNPYNGINDRGHNGMSPYVYTWSTGYGGSVDAYILAGYGSFMTGSSYYAGTSSISIASDSDLSKDYRLELPQPINKGWWRGTTGAAAADVFSPYGYLNWFATNQGTSYFDQGMPSGKFLWVSDYYGQNATNPLDIFLLDAGNTGNSCELRWFNSSGVAKYGYQDAASGTGPANWAGDTLQLATNFGSLLIVKYDFVYDEDAAGNILTTGKEKFFAYFVPN